MGGGGVNIARLREMAGPALAHIDQVQGWTLAPIVLLALVGAVLAAAVVVATAGVAGIAVLVRRIARATQARRHKPAPKGVGG